MRQAATPVADESVRGGEQLLRQSGARDEIPHQDEQRDDRQRVREPGLVHDLRRGGQGRLPAAREADADDAHATHGEGQRHAQDGEQENDGEADERGDHSATPSPSASAAGGRAISRRCTTPASPHSTDIP